MYRDAVLTYDLVEIGVAFCSGGRYAPLRSHRGNKLSDRSNGLFLLIADPRDTLPLERAKSKANETVMNRRLLPAGRRDALLR
jgi:hypothetical protein